MTRTLSEQLARRPVNEARVEQIAETMRQEVRAARLQDLRLQQELTQTQIANEMNISQNRVSQIESGQVDRAEVQTIRKYIEALGGKLTLQASFGSQSFVIG